RVGPVKLVGGHVRYETLDGVGWITLTRPQVLNALDGQLAAELAAAVAAAAEDPDAWVVVVTGEGRGFSSGMDRTALSAGGCRRAPSERRSSATGFARSMASRTWASWWSRRSAATALAAGFSWPSRATCGSARPTRCWDSARRATG